MTTSLSDVIRDQTKLFDVMTLEKLDVAHLTRLHTRAIELSRDLMDGPLEGKRQILQSVVERIELTLDHVTLVLRKPALARILNLPCPEDHGTMSIRVPVRLRRRGVETKLIIDSPDAKTCNLDTELCRLTAQAHSWFDQLALGKASTVRAIARREKTNEHEITRILQLAFLAPKIVEDIFAGRQAEGVSVYRLRRLSSLPFAWQEQAEMLENLR